MNLEKLKLSNNQYLSSVGIDINQNLPLIENLNEVNPRSSEDVASRLCALAYVIGIGYDANRTELSKHIETFNLWNHVSEYEKTLLVSKEVSKQDKFNMQWLNEAAQALAWSIGLVEINHFKHCDDDLAKKVPFKKDPSHFIESAQIRPISEIQRQSDLLYRMHWYTRNCQLNGKQSKLNNSIILERRRAIDWVYGVEKHWDEVTLDT